jgi:hypothetical protein
MVKVKTRRGALPITELPVTGPIKKFSAEVEQNWDRVR